MSNDKEIIRLDNVSKTYNMKNNKVSALSNVSLSFEKGKFYAIMGHSGSGKSTLINLIGLLDNNYIGNYKFDNKNVTKLDEKTLSIIRNKKIGFIFQDFYLDEHLKAYENVMLPMLVNSNIKKSDRKSIATNLLNYLGLTDRINHFPKEMSGGECQRVAIARALANNPDIILADEPTGNLDEQNEEKVFSILKQLAISGKCVIAVSHTNDIKNYADVIYSLKKGIVVEGNTNEII